VLPITWALLTTACGEHPPEDDIGAELDRLVERTRLLAGRAATFDHDRVLEGIGVDPANGVLYRLDEHLEAIDHRETEGSSANRQSGSTLLDLGGFDLQPGGIASNPVDLPLRDIGSLELQIKTAFRQRLEIELRSEQDNEAVKIDLHVVGGGALRTYRLELAEAITSWKGERLEGVRFRAADRREDSDIEIRQAVFLSPTAAFADRAYGLAHRRQGRETRHAIFQWSSSVLRFPLRLESMTEAELDLGVAALLVDRPVMIEVALVHAGERKRLWSTRIAAGTGWIDRRLPLDLAVSGDALIELGVASEEPNIVFWSNPAVIGPTERRFNVIMVLEDALRADHLSCYGYPRQTTPVKDAFADRGLRFTRCFAQATKTRFSCPSFMTSLYPTATGVEGNWNPHPSLHPNHITIAEVLRRRGFLTASIHQNPNAGSPAGLHQGFSYLFESVPGRAQDLYTGLPLQFIEQHHQRNFLLYLHLADPHEPYDPPAETRGWFEEVEGRYPRDDPRWMLESRRALYDGEIAANDRWFGHFLEELENLGLSDDTLVIFMSDHGEHLGEHGLWSHNPPGYRQVLHTPLIMVYPRRLPGEVVIDEIVQNLDLLPTVLELAGVDGGELLMQGESLVPLLRVSSQRPWSRNLAYSEEALLKKSRNDPRPYGSIFFDRWHVLDSLYAPMKLFDLVLDFAEEEPLPPTRSLRSTMLTFLRDMQLAESEIWRGITGGEEATLTLDPEAIRELRALGYLE
jgi:arylsulfatase